MNAEIKEIISALQKLIEKGESIKNAGLNWQKSDRWKKYCVEKLKKHVTDEEANELNKIQDFRPPPTPLPKFVPAPRLDSNGYIEGRQEENFKRDLDNKINFLKSLKENILEDPDYWTKKIEEDKKDRITASGNESAAIIEKICNEFHEVVKKLQKRYNNREPFQIKDEYDVQDLLKAILSIFFKDIRPEECTPSYAGSSNRMDILLKEEKIVIEVKMTRKNLKDKEIKKELIIDKENYRIHPDCLHLICFIYDPEGLLKYPVALKSDLHCEEDKYKVSVFINP
ncbi:malate dehydrogenase [candidate division KSB1 bacterium]